MRQAEGTAGSAATIMFFHFNEFHARNRFQNFARLLRNFDTTDHMTFDPDLIILMCRPSQAEIVLRANGYRTGRGWNAIGTSVAGCACLFNIGLVSCFVILLVYGLIYGL